MVFSRLLPHSSPRCGVVVRRQAGLRWSSGVSDAAVEAATSIASPSNGSGPKPMISDERKARMEGQGWQVIGGHSATKLCRWTKSMLQGKGGCYKHTFYGIASHQCMEHTPNVSCANKCVFCWRNHINPVSLDWKADHDDPERIIEESLAKHLATIEQQCLSPNALEHRKTEARQVRHCALSLVGEPVAYPRIAEFVAKLHRRRISTFLVTNGQFPDALRALPTVTQLYVSCDAADPEELREVGRPLFRDFWERYMSSLEIVRSRAERTVCRLTLMRHVNMERPKDWAKLLRHASPDFVELKAATFAPIFDKGGLTMMNMPTYQEVKSFAEELAALMPDYGLACGHEHSNAVLLASERFRAEDGSWRTWIDFERFADAASVADSRGSNSVDLLAVDYTETTPQWALYGSSCQGFAPTETRKLRLKPRPALSTEKDASRIPASVRTGLFRGRTGSDTAAPITE
eukprot:TRINITY_DN74874_c0_g1_i1.p1 TRINITY_DN74874_c0_g1~~TRINITY_DN74874_c0_g1_i1.p1  ORF type:complete len:476 (-),score=60.21 TRINITY_DN74874_c0_g1_i1:264-1649(-)